MRLRAAQLAFLVLAAAWIAPWVPHPAWVLGGAVPLLLAWRMRWREGVKLGGCFLLLLGLTTLRLHSGPQDLRRLIFEAVTVEMRARVAGDAVPTDRGLRVPVVLTEIRYFPEWQRVEGRAQLRVNGSSAVPLIPGTVLQIQGQLRPRRVSFTGLRQGHWQIDARGSDLSAHAAGAGLRPLAAFFSARERLSARIGKAAAADAEAVSVLQALLLARRGDVDDEWTQTFARTGLLHIFAISGLHLGLLSALLMRLCSGFRVPYRQRVFVVLPLLFLFAACTGFRSSALRAWIMTACLLSAPGVYRRPHAGSAFALAVVIILGLAPEQLFDLGFQYSFLMVGGLLVFAGMFEQQARRWVRGDPWAPVEAQETWWRQRLLRPLVSSLMISAICLVIAAPLTAARFHLFSPVALLGNVLAVPLAFLLLAAGFPALLLLWLPLPAASLALWPARLSARLLLDWVEFLDRIPGGVWRVRSPALWELLLFYGLPVLAVHLPRTRRVCLALGLTAMGVSLGLRLQEMRRPEWVVLDADRGQAAWLRQPGQGALLVDAGSDWSGRDVRQALERAGVPRLEAVFLTHPSRAHVEGLAEVMQTYTPERIFVAAPDAGHPLYADWTVEPLSAGDQFLLGGWQVDVLWPPADFRARAAGQRSLVLRFSRGAASVLVMGGADERVEQALVAEGRLLPVRQIQAANSPRVVSMDGDFLRALRPEAVVFSGRGFPGHEDARDLSESRAVGMGIPVWRVRPGGFLRIDPARGTVREDRGAP